ncbi:hypothetical protein ACGFNV_37275 [Streptomyces sp. NPDC048751]|uniref:hypothetical protein n=1 Tax=Streptomyces sp. NPDC048751 TaxID=3365591 RepID=UPI00371F4A29
MLRIIDARTGEPVPAAPVRRGLARVEVHAPGHGTGALRVLLVADLLVRALELGGTPVVALLAGGRERAELRAAAAALGVRPFEEGPELAGGIGSARALHVVGEADTAGGAVAPVLPDQAGDAVAPVLPEEGGDAVAPVLSDEVRVAVAPVVPDAPVASDADPAVLRLALLSHHHREPVPLDAEGLGAARDTLARWRRAVAEWARRPSKPVPEDVKERLRTAWEDDLDVPGVLGVLRWVEEAGPELPDGARFETYAYADRLLGLELTRDLGAWA